MSFGQSVEIGVDCQILLLLSFLTAAEFYNLGYIQGTKGALTQSDFCAG